MEITKTSNSIRMKENNIELIIYIDCYKNNCKLSRKLK